MPPWGATKEMRGREARVESFSRMIPTEWVEAEREKKVGVLERVSRPAWEREKSESTRMLRRDRYCALRPGEDIVVSDSIS
jgi:hypothetical protein